MINWGLGAIPNPHLIKNILNFLKFYYSSFNYLLVAI